MTPRPVEILGADVPSLARGLPGPGPLESGTLFLLGSRGGMRVAPDAGFTAVFGRNEAEVHVPVGAGDGAVSRRQGTISRVGGRWMIRNTGRLPLRLPGPQLVLSGHEEALADAYTPVFMRTAPRREHLLEVHVVGVAESVAAVADDAVTVGPRVWMLSDRERLVLTVLGQRYLRHERAAAPVTWKAVADELEELRPDEGWSAKRAEHVVATVRSRLARRVPGLTREEVGEPVGNTLNHHLLLELLATATLVPPDLALLEA